jgi:hypothetical protein
MLSLRRLLHAHTRPMIGCIELQHLGPQDVSHWGHTLGHTYKRKKFRIHEFT